MVSRAEGLFQVERRTLEVLYIFLNHAFAAFYLRFIIAVSSDFGESSVFEAFVDLFQKVAASIIMASVAELLVQYHVSDEGIFVSWHIESFSA